MRQHGSSELALCQEKNRYFLIQVLRCIRFLVKEELPFHGKGFGHGKLAHLLEFAGIYQPMIPEQMSISRNHPHLRKPYHSRDIDFFEVSTGDVLFTAEFVETQ